VKHISTAVWAPPGFLQWHEMALQWPKCAPSSLPPPYTWRHRRAVEQGAEGRARLPSSTSNRRSSACRALTAYCGGWRRCACLDAKTRVLAVRALASTTCNDFIADLLFFVFERRANCHTPSP
jgi:hypothetical protein